MVVATSSLTGRERRILSLLVRRYEQYDGHATMSRCRLDWLDEGSASEHEQTIEICNRLIGLGLAETEGLLLSAVMPRAAEELRAPAERRRLSALAG